MADSKRIGVVTGASRGLGRVLVERFAAAGWSAIGTGRSDKPADFPAGAHYAQFDASDPAACERFWAKMEQDHPEATVCLVNNAGGYVGGGLTDTAPEDYAAMMQQTYFTSVYMTRALTAHVARARIINVISSSALAARKNNSAYGAAKAGEMHFFQSLQAEFKPEQYQITNLYPKDIATTGPRPHAMDPVELAEFVRGLAESEASYYLRDVTLYPTE